MLDCIIKINPKFLRPEELKYLKGDSQKIREKLGWKPTWKLQDWVNLVTSSKQEKINA